MATSNRVFTARGLIPRTNYTIEVRPDHFDIFGGIFIISVSPAIVTMRTEISRGNSPQYSDTPGLSY